MSLCTLPDPARRAASVAAKAQSTARENWQSWHSRSPTLCPGAGPSCAGPAEGRRFCGSLAAELEPVQGGDKEADYALRSSELPVHGGIQAESDWEEVPTAHSC